MHQDDVSGRHRRRLLSSGGRDQRADRARSRHAHECASIHLISPCCVELNSSQLDESAGKTRVSARKLAVGSRRDGFSPEPSAHPYILNEAAFCYVASRGRDSAVSCAVLGTGAPLGYRFFRRQFAIALAALEQVSAHGVPRLLWRVAADRLKDRLVLFLDAGEILAQSFGGALKRANALPRNDQTAEKIQKF